MLDWLKPILGEAYTDDIDGKITAAIDNGYAPKAEITRLTNESAAAKKQYERDLNTAKLGYLLDARLTKEGAVNLKAVKALLDCDKIKLDGDNVSGLDEQLKALRESDSWAFAPAAPAAPPKIPGSGGNPPPAPAPQSNPLPSGTVIF